MLLKQNVISLAAFIAISICPSVACQSYAGLVYQFVDYPQLQNGGTLNGTVAFTGDGSLGHDVLFTDFSWTATSPEGNASASFIPDSGFIQIPRQLKLDGDTLVLSLPENSTQSVLVFGEIFGDIISPKPFFQTIELEYRLSTIPGDSRYTVRTDDKILWSTPLPSMGLGETSLVIARLVPEPATVTLLAFGSLLTLIRRNRPN